jgi:hypothetical protein
MLLSRQPSLLRRHNVRPVCRMMEECRERVVMAFPNADITRAIFAHILKSWFPKYNNPWCPLASICGGLFHFLPFPPIFGTAAQLQLPPAIEALSNCPALPPSTRHPHPTEACDCFKSRRVPPKHPDVRQVTLLQYGCHHCHEASGRIKPVGLLIILSLWLVASTHHALTRHRECFLQRRL